MKHRTMGFPAPLEAVSFYDTLESTSLAPAADVDLITDLDQLAKQDFLAKLIDFGIDNPEFLV